MKLNPGIWAAAFLLATPALAQTSPGSTSPSATQRERMQQPGSMDPPHGGMMKLEHKAPQATIDQLQRRVREYEQAWSSHDLEKLSSFYSPDATFISPNGAAAGRSQIRDLLRRDHEGAMKDSSVSFTIQSIRTLPGNLAIMDVTQTLTGVTQQAGRSIPTEFHATVVGRRVGNQWMVEAVRVFPTPTGASGVGGAGEPVPSHSPPTEPGTGGTGDFGTEGTPSGNEPRNTDVPEKK